MSKKQKATSSFTAVLECFDSKLWYFHIVVPVDIARPFIDGNNRRVLCTLNGVETFQCALMPKAGGSFFININKQIRSKLGLKIGSRVQATISKDESEYGLPMPDELDELLKMDDEGNTLFHALTPGKQRTLLHLIGSPKGIDIRIRRAICVVDHLKNNGGKIDYKLLNEAFKHAP